MYQFKAHSEFAILCQRCGAPGPWARTKKDAILLAGESGWLIDESATCPVCRAIAVGLIPVTAEIRGGRYVITLPLSRIYSHRLGDYLDELVYEDGWDSLPPTAREALIASGGDQTALLIQIAELFPEEEVRFLRLEIR
ncbi:hypothetical protein [Thermogutta sp.]|uniref:hypothetical protein n=1 Tax=Thermogutta sp. TaxID=1962930 RepID=UPI0032207569